MKLRDWIQREGMTGKDFAKIADTTPATISRLASGKQEWLCLPIARSIYKATNGEVTPNDFMRPQPGDDS